MNVVLVVVVDALLIKMASGSGVSLGLLGFGRTCEHDLEPLKNQVPRGRLNPTGHLDFSKIRAHLRATSKKLGCVSLPTSFLTVAPGEP